METKAGRGRERERKGGMKEMEGLFGPNQAMSGCFISLLFTKSSFIILRVRKSGFLGRTTTETELQVCFRKVMSTILLLTEVDTKQT